MTAAGPSLDLIIVPKLPERISDPEPPIQPVAAGARRAPLLRNATSVDSAESRY